MEGKAVLFKKFADLDAFDIEVAEEDPQRVSGVGAGVAFGGGCRGADEMRGGFTAEGKREKIGQSPPPKPSPPTHPSPHKCIPHLIPPPPKLVDIVVALEPTFGGVNLEDIKSPECFFVERECQRRMNIPVFHVRKKGGRRRK
jgi:malic enzyme